MDHTKIYPADLGSSCRELSNGGLGCVVALLDFSELIFRVLIADSQSSCTGIKKLAAYSPSTGATTYCNR